VRDIPVSNHVRSQVSQIPAEERRRLVERCIEPHPHKAGRSEFVLGETGAAVWSIIGYLPAVSGDIEQVARDCDVSTDAVIAAISYYLDHEAVINERLLQNRGTDEQ